jgi:hypothetical protein
MKYALRATAALILMVGGRLLEHRWYEEFQSVQGRLELISHDLDGWEGHDHALEGQQASWAQLGDRNSPGYINREYFHPATGRRVNLLLVWGRPDPISEHTPDQCYPSAGFKPVTDLTRKALDVEPPRPPEAFFHREYAKEGPDSARLKIYWAWNADGRWQAPDDAHEALARHRQYYTYGGCGLMKLYVIREVSGDDEAKDADTCEEFLRVLLPEFRRQLFPGT